MGKRVGIICPGRNGDVAESTAILPYADELWGADCSIHWFVQSCFAQVLEHQPGVIVHEIDIEDGGECARIARREVQYSNFDVGYMTAPWLNWELIFKVPLPLIPAVVVGEGRGWLRNRMWQPHIVVTSEEVEEVHEFMRDVPAGARIMLETDCFSHQGNWEDSMTTELAERMASLDVVFLAASFGYADKMRALGITNVVGLDSLNYRQLSEAWNHSDVYIGVPSGAASVSCADRCNAGLRFEYLTPDRRPGAAGMAPDWGTSSISGAYTYCDRQRLLDQAVERAGVHLRGSLKARRKQARRYRRRRIGANRMVS